VAVTETVAVWLSTPLVAVTVIGAVTLTVGVSLLLVLPSPSPQLAAIAINPMVSPTSAVRLRLFGNVARHTPISNEHATAIGIQGAPRLPG
jgi:hypothetical protein